MRLSEIDLNLLVVFEAIYREGNLTRAAKKLHLTQPALSHALSRLRELFGDPLFSRTGRAMVPTPFARNMIVPVREALTTLERSLFPGQTFDAKGSQRRFLVGVRDVLEATLLPALMVQLQSEARGVELYSIRIPSQELEAELIAGTIDAAIDIGMPMGAAIRHAALSEDAFALVARRDHPAFEQALDLEAYLALSHVLVSSRHKGPGLVDVVLHRMGKRRRIALRCQNDLAACHVVAQSDLVLTMPERYAELVNRGFDNVVHPLPLQVPPVDVHLYWHTGTEREPALVWLREQLLKLRA
jgi:DNA-binding transcriptional LysR family regulator